MYKLDDFLCEMQSDEFAFEMEYYYGLQEEYAKDEQRRAAGVPKI